MLEGLAEVISKLEFSPFRLRVIGTAGAGKSQLTLHLCNQALANGRRPLLLCFNRPFADRLRPLAPDGVVVNTYLGFCAEFSESAGLDIDFDHMGDDPEFWHRIQEHVMGADIREEQRYDCLIVDEGQDFHQEWFEILGLFLTEDASIIWLEDPMQNLRGTEPIALPDFVTYRENANYRSPATIAGFIKDVLGVDFDQRNNLPGLGVAVHKYDAPHEQMKIVSHRIQELVRVGFKHDEIVVISCRGMASTAFKDCDKLGSLAVRRFTGDYDNDGSQIYTDGKIYFDTIYRFKGQQAPAVILVDIDETLGETEFAKRVLYCGMTRATVRLELVVSTDNPWRGVFEESAGE
jgi:superfamily I DNA and RNA helicase